MKTDKPLGRKSGKQSTICRLKWLSFKGIPRLDRSLSDKCTPLRAVGLGCIISLAVALKATINVRFLQENPHTFPVSYGS